MRKNQPAATALPPLNALKAFESAGRNLSFKIAAEELHVTAGAVSRQIALLEEHLGCALFERSHRLVKLTEDGREYLTSVRELFDGLRRATDVLRAKRESRAMHIWCPMTFGLRWLVPRLPRFKAAHPERDVVFTTSLGIVDVELRHTDVAIRIGRGDWPGLTSRRIVGIELTPVCHPSLLQGQSSPASVQSLKKLTLLQSAARPDYWRTWLKEAGADDIDPDRGMPFESVSLAYQMAIEGAGVAMGQHALVAADLAAGRLVAPFRQLTRIEDAFYLIYPTRLEKDEYVRSFTDWLLAEAQEEEAQRYRQFGIEALP
ncbi:transcriptional regulator GcvA [soil metagenome]